MYNRNPSPRTRWRRQKFECKSQSSAPTFTLFPSFCARSSTSSGSSRLDWIPRRPGKDETISTAAASCSPSSLAFCGSPPRAHPTFSHLCCVKVHEPDMLAGRIREASLRELAHRPVHAVEVVHLPRPLVPTPGEAPAAPRTKASASSREGEARAATEAASRAENVLEHLEGVLSAVELEASAATAASATCLLVLQAFLSDLVVNPALLGVTKHLIGLGNLGKLLLSPLLVVRILVRVVLERQFPVRLLQGRLVSIALDAQELVCEEGRRGSALRPSVVLCRAAALSVGGATYSSLCRPAPLRLAGHRQGGSESWWEPWWRQRIRSCGAKRSAALSHLPHEREPRGKRRRRGDASDPTPSYPGSATDPTRFWSHRHLIRGRMWILLD
eukprot:scaffold878_cov271-Pinguiococcus_pyrenoidosus.AAC.14